MESIDTLIVGAGVVGLAIAMKQSYKNDVLIIDKNASFGEETSSRNSEVIHAGIYYPKDSLKAKLCVNGKVQLYHYCKQRKIPHKKIGKLLVATAETQETFLLNTIKKASDNGVNDLIHLDKQAIKAIEPKVNAYSALLSPSTGIINAHEYMNCLVADIESNGGIFSPLTEIVRVERCTTGFLVTVKNQKELFKFKCKKIINCSGLYADKVTSSIEDFPQHLIPKISYCKGHYFSYSGQSPFSHLIYPIPTDNGLGIHATLDLGGQLKFGPDTKYIDKIDYSVDHNLRDEFADTIRVYFPDVEPSKLQPAYSGIRPKLVKNKFSDFVIQSQNEHGIYGLVNLFGIESPGLTASLAIADYVKEILEK